jgi:hypothetical protein
MFLIYILIILFIILVGYQVILAFSSNSNGQYKLIEGLENSDTTTSTTSQEYKPYNVNDPNNSLILAQQNAGNIEVLKGRVDNLDGVKKSVDDMKLSIDSMQTQIDGLVQQQADYAQDIAGSTPVDITGTDGETTENVEDSIEEEDNTT